VAMLWAERPVGDPQQGKGFFLFVTAYRPTLGPTQPPIKLELGLKWLRHEDGDSYAFKAWCLIEQRETFSWRGT